MGWFDAREPAARQALVDANAALVLAIGRADVAETMRFAREAADARASIAALDSERASLLAASEAARASVGRMAADYEAAHRRDAATRAPAALLVARSWPVSAFDFEWQDRKSVV